jgi:O-antigen/teichoic acid export membrane protein
MIKSVFQTLGSRILSAILNFTTIILLSRYLGASGKGLSSIFITQVSFIVILTEFVGGSTLVYLTPRYNLRSLLKPTLSWTLIICFIFVLIAYYTQLLPTSVFSIFQLFIAGLLVSVYSILQKILSSFEKFETLSLLNIFQSSVLIIILLLIFTIGNFIHPQAYSYSIIVSYFLSVLIAALDLIKSNPHHDLPNASIKQLVTLGFINQSAHVFHLISTRIAFWILLNYINAKATGIFSNAIQLSESVWVITNSFATVQYAKISNSYNTINNQHLTNVIGRITFFITTVCLLILNILPNWIFITIFGNDFATIKEPLLVLSLGIIFFNWMLIYGHYFSGQGQYKYNTLSVIAGALFTVVSFLLLKKHITIFTASVLTAFSYFISGSCILLIYLKKTNQSWQILIPQKNDFTELKKLF